MDELFKNEDKVLSPLDRVERINLPGSNECPQLLSFVESQTREVPFEIKRVYWLHNLKEGAERGFHGHKELQQLMVCVSGSVIVTLHDGLSSAIFSLDDPRKGLLLPSGLWREVRVTSSDPTPACVLNLASHSYDENDYIRNFDHYKAWALETTWGKCS